MRDLAKLSLVFLMFVACGNDQTSRGGMDAPAAPDDGNGSNSMIDAPGPDAFTGGPGVECGTMTCTTGMECCTTFANQMASYSCITAGGNCQGVTAECDGPEDCPTTGDVCCGHFGGGGGGNGVQCDTAGQGCLELCHTATDCSMTGAMCCTPQFGNSKYCAMTCPP
jgi:hypothetical protein